MTNDQGGTFRLVISDVHRSLCLIVKEGDFVDPPILTDDGLSKKLEPRKVIALTSIYVDDYLTAGPKPVVQAFLSYFRRIGTLVTSDVDFPFLGINIQKFHGLFFARLRTWVIY